MNKTQLDKLIADGEKKVAENEAAAAVALASPPPSLDDLDLELETPPVQEDKKPVTPAPVEDDWKVKHDKMFGTLSAKIGTLEKQLDGYTGLAAEVETLRRENAELLRKNTETPPPASTIVPDTETAALIEALKDSFGEDDTDRILKLIDIKASQKADALVKGELERVGKDITEIKAGATKSAKQVYIDKLTAGESDAMQVVTDQKFAAFLQSEVMYESVLAADARQDSDTVLKAIRKYKATLTPAGGETPEEKAERERQEALDDMIQPGKGHGAKPPTPGPKTYTHAQIDKFVAEYIRGNSSIYYKDGAPIPKAKAIYEDMLKALDEGRVT